MLDPFSLPFVQRGAVEVALLAVGAGLLGTWIVLRGLAFYAHAVGTAAFPGLVVAEGLALPATLGAFATAGIVAVLVAVLSRRHREAYDTATALVLVGALAAGVILASDVFGSPASVEQLLFGSLLLTDAADQRLALAASAAVLAGTAVAGPRWLATGFDTQSARAQGLRAARVRRAAARARRARRDRDPDVARRAAGVRAARRPRGHDAPAVPAPGPAGRRRRSRSCSPRGSPACGCPWSSTGRPAPRSPPWPAASSR